MVGKLQAVVAAIAPSVQRRSRSAHDFALRIDRVLVNSGELQKYGSQVSAVDGRWQAKPMPAPEQVDQHRPDGAGRLHRCGDTGVSGAARSGEIESARQACLATKTSFPRPWRGGGRLFRCRAWDIAGTASAGHGPALPVVVTPLPNRALH